MQAIAQLPGTAFAEKTQEYRGASIAGPEFFESYLTSYPGYFFSPLTSPVGPQMLTSVERLTASPSWCPADVTW
jgi:hypothetical protein